MKRLKLNFKLIAIVAIGLAACITGILFFHLGYTISASIICFAFYYTLEDGERDSEICIGENQLNLFPLLIFLLLWPIIEVSGMIFLPSLIICLTAYMLRRPLCDYIWPDEYNNNSFLENVKYNIDVYVLPVLRIVIVSGILSGCSFFLTQIDEGIKEKIEAKKIEQSEKIRRATEQKTTATVKEIKSETVNGNTVYYVVVSNNISQKTDTLSLDTSSGAIWLKEGSVVSYNYSPENIVENFRIIEHP